LALDEIALLKSTISEYRSLCEIEYIDTDKEPDAERLISDLSKNHDWTRQGAHAIVSLAHNYGSFMLRNALALAIVLEKEDGEIGF